MFLLSIVAIFLISDNSIFTFSKTPSENLAPIIFDPVLSTRSTILFEKIYNTIATTTKMSIIHVLNENPYSDIETKKK